MDTGQSRAFKNQRPVPTTFSGKLHLYQTICIYLDPTKPCKALIIRTNEVKTPKKGRNREKCKRW
jgi:hypothetical protein